LGFEPIFGAFLFAVLSAFGIGFIKRKGGTKTDVAIGLFWSFGMALGILFIGLTPGYPPDLTSYLFGNILSVLKSDLILASVVALLIIAIIIIFYNDWKSYLFDEEFTFIKGKKTAVMDYVLLVMVAFSVVALIKVVGIILVIALLTAPAASASLITNKLKNRIYLSILFGIFFSFAGLWLSYELNIASGAAIVILSVLFYSVLYLIVYVRKCITNKKVKNYE
jgi:zinc transport system permease protein